MTAKRPAHRRNAAGRDGKAPAQWAFLAAAAVLLVAAFVHLELISAFIISGKRIPGRTPVGIPWRVALYVGANLAPSLILVLSSRFLARRMGPQMHRLAWFQPTLLSTLLSLNFLNKAQGLLIILSANALAYGPVLIDFALRRQVTPTAHKTTQGSAPHA